MSIDISDTQWDFIPPNSKTIDTNELDPFSLFIFYLWAVWSLLWLVGSIVFIIRLRTGDTNIRVRSPVLSLLSAFGAEIAFSCTSWDIAVSRKHFPCCLDLYYILIFLPLYFVPFVLRFAKYILTMRYISTLSHNPNKILNPHNPWVRESTYVSFLGLIMSILLLIANIFQFQKMSDWVNAYGCQLRSYTFIVLIILVSLCAICFAIGFSFMFKNEENDPYHLKTEFISCSFVWICCLVPYLVLYRLNKYPNIQISMMFVFIVDGYFTSILWPIYLSYKHAPEDQMNDSDILSTFDQMILDPECYQIIEKIAQIKVIPEVPPFCRDVLLYRSLENKSQIKNEAERIFNTYVKKGSVSQNNFSDDMVADVERRLSSPTNDLFNMTYNEASKLLKTGNFLDEIQKHPEYIQLVEKRKREKANRNQTENIFAEK